MRALTPSIGAILAGGDGTRMGGLAKGLLEVRQRRTVEWVADAIAPLVEDLLMVGGSKVLASGLGARGIDDVRPGLGAIGGMHAAFAEAGDRGCFVVAWDLPFVTTGLLWALRERALAADADGGVCERPGSRWGVEPLCAWYDVGRCRSALEGALDAGDTRAGGWLAQVRLARLPHAEMAAYGDPRHLLLDLDTPEDYEAARAAAQEMRDA
ncbi:MAG: molybdenum cofactor guanylyltransferase [Gemmatimonadetes bacterium]|nr:molybdenum cofactor guanylyltransferase [Gemmatimonadota bacterium]